MTQFTVTEVSSQVRPYNTDFGPKKAYRVHLRNGDGTEHLNIEFRRNANSPAPTVGQEFEGDLVDQGQYGQRLQLANKTNTSGAWSGSKEPRPEDPKKSAVILRQHSQDMALRYAQLRATQGQLPKDFALGDLFLVADRFDEDARKARDAA